MAVIFNAKGTTSPYFLLGKAGTTLFQGSADPTGSYTAAAGDVWFDTNTKTLKFRNAGNSDWVQGSIDITGDATISGNLTVNGTTTLVSTTNTSVSDSLIELSTGTTGSPFNDAGIIIERGDSDNAYMGWDESADTFILGTTTATGASTGDLTITAAPVSISALTLGGTAVTATAAELNYTDGVTSNIQTQLDGKQDLFTGTTGAVTIPVGTTLQRPGSPTAGMMRFNSDTSRFEGYNGTAWVPIDTLYS